jgi:S1-C subfamily serine protease
MTSVVRSCECYVLAVAWIIGCSNPTDTQPCPATVSLPIYRGSVEPPTSLGSVADSVVAVVIERTVDGRTFESLCTGVRIDATHVLSARHCVEGVGRFTVRIVEGPKSDAVHGTSCQPTVSREGDGSAGLYLHPHLDAAILLVQPLADAVVAPLATSPPKVGAPAILAGYGLDETNQAGTRHFLNSQVLRVVGDFIDTQTSGDAGACEGDSGGPLFLQESEQWRLAGTLSLGSPDCRGVDEYLSVLVLRDWLQSVQ